MLEAEPLASPAHSGGHLLGDEERPERTGELFEPCSVADGRHEDAASEERFVENRRRPFFRRQILKNIHTGKLAIAALRREIAPDAVRRRDAEDVSCFWQI